MKFLVSYINLVIYINLFPCDYFFLYMIPLRETYPSDELHFFSIDNLNGKAPNNIWLLFQVCT